MPTKTVSKEKNATTKTKKPTKEKPQGKLAFIEILARKTNSSKKDAEVWGNAFLECLNDTLAKGIDQTFVGFGTFAVKERPARIGRNPQTGEEMTIAAKRVVTFKPALALKKAIN